jgi:hypothetical protein
MCWPVDTSCWPEYETDVPVEVRTRSEALAISTLRRLTAYRVGGCAITVRPCKRGCAAGSPIPYYYSQGFQPHIGLAGFWVNSCGCTTDCSCAALCEVALPSPVTQVEEVKIDGAIVAATDYRVDGDRLVWTGAGECPWPTCQDLTKPDTAIGTFSVTYLNTYPVDAAASYVAGVLAVEYAKACTNPNECRLPSNVSVISRQGITMEINSGAFPDGFTGIREVDSFISLWNPKGMTQGSKVWTPDLRSPRVVR